ncbi:MAG: hypothetical protein IPK61_17720 [Saprospiraceae bacterium]|nr:hypothetical protein [Saprospiraceae bacterium]
MTPSQAKEAYIDNYCQEKGYQVVKTEVPNGTKLEISNLSEKIPLVLYSSGSIVPQGSPNSLLRKEFDQLKTELDKTQTYSKIWG